MRAIVAAALLAACGGHDPETAGAPAAKLATVDRPAVAEGPHGRVDEVRFDSAALGVSKRYFAYLPASYDKRPNAHYPVFYYLHGLTGDETSWLKGGHLDRVADELGLEAIVVMPDGDDGWYVDSDAPIDYDRCMKDGTGLFMPAAQKPAETCVRQRHYETYIAHDLVNEIDARYRTIKTRDGRAIAGLSMGGFGALELGMRHQDLFAAAASHSGVVSMFYKAPHPYGTGIVELITDVDDWKRAVPQIGEWVVMLFGPDIAHWKTYDPPTLAKTLAPGKLALYLDCGNEDDFQLQDAASYLHDVLDQRHIEHAFFLGPGGHNFRFWGPRLPESLKFLRDHTTRPAQP